MKMKMILILVTLVTSVLFGCSDPVQVTSSEYGVVVDAKNGVNFNKIYNSETVLIPYAWNMKDYVHVVDGTTMTKTYSGTYYNEASKVDLKLTLDVTFKVKSDNKSIEQALKMYQSVSVGQLKRHISISTIEKTSVSPKIKDAVRPVINSTKADGTQMTVEDAAVNSIAIAIAAKQALIEALEGEPVLIIDVRVNKVGLPEHITNKKIELQSIADEELIMRKRLEMQKMSLEDRHAFEMIKAKKDVEVDSVYGNHWDTGMKEVRFQESIDNCIALNEAVAGSCPMFHTVIMGSVPTIVK